MSMPSGKQPASGAFARAISEEIRAAMARHRVSGASLATKTGMSQSYISKRLRDEVPFTANDIEVISDVLREDLLVLITTAAKRSGR